MLDQIKQLTKARESFVIETTLSGLSYARHIIQWKKLGYQVSLTFLSLPSPTIAISRVKNRVKQGGHNIPAGVIRRRFFAGRKKFNTIYKDLVDHWVLFDNTDDTPVILDRKVE